MEQGGTASVTGGGRHEASADMEEPSVELLSAAHRVRAAVERAVAGRSAECLLLSGGLDTAVLAPLADRSGTRAAVTVLATPDAPDREPSRTIAAGLGWEHHAVETTLEGLLAETDFVVRTLKSFDPMEVRNSVVISRALREAALRGYRTVMTGDGADELFGGYSFMWNKGSEEFEEYSRRMAATMRFSSHPLGQAFGLEVRAPYTDPEIVALATAMPKRLKVAVRDGTTVGKWVLRWAFPDCESRWRRKDPIEVGSGSTRLPEWLAGRIPSSQLVDVQRKIRQADRVHLRDAEHWTYYRAFRRAWPQMLEDRTFGPESCTQCGFDLPRRDSTFCPTCGAYPARP